MPKDTLTVPELLAETVMADVVPALMLTDGINRLVPPQVRVPSVFPTNALLVFASLAFRTKVPAPYAPE